MLRRSIGIWVVVVSLSGVGMFLLKHEVQSRKSELDSLHEYIINHQEAIRVLRAEWSFLNQPSRIERLARKHLGLRPLESRQIIHINKFSSQQSLGSEEK